MPVSARTAAARARASARSVRRRRSAASAWSSRGVVAELGDGGGLFDGQLSTLHGIALFGASQGQRGVDLCAAGLGAAGDLCGVESVVGQGLEQCQALAGGDGGAVFVLAPLGHQSVDGGLGAVLLVADDHGGDLD